MSHDAPIVRLAAPWGVLFHSRTETGCEHPAGFEPEWPTKTGAPLNGRESRVDLGREVRRKGQARIAIAGSASVSDGRDGQRVVPRATAKPLPGGVARPNLANRLIWGDKKYVLPSLLPEFAGKVDLIYIDPPFDTGADFSYTANVPGVSEQENGAIAFTKQPSIVELKAYRDTWGRGLDSYLHWLYETCILLYELLSQSGSLYVHIEPDTGNYARLILRLLTDLHQIITRLDVVLVWLGVALAVFDGF